MKRWKWIKSEVATLRSEERSLLFATALVIMLIVDAVIFVILLLTGESALRATMGATVTGLILLYVDAPRMITDVKDLRYRDD